MTPKCNQTGCDNPAAFRFTWPGQDSENGICAEHAPNVRLVAGALGFNIPLIPLKEPADPPDLETLTALKLKEHGRGDPLSDPEVMKCVQEISHLTWNSSATFQAKLEPIISRYLQKARAEASERLNRECDVLKESNDELRDQLCANAKLISELQHTVRLVQETHSQQVHECAVKAVMALAKADYISKNIFPDKPATIICEAFGAPAKDEYGDALEEAFQKRKALGVMIAFTDFRDGFEAAWKLAKGDK